MTQESEGQVQVEAEGTEVEGLAEQDSEARFELYGQAEQLIVSDAACVPLWFGKNYLLVKPYVQGYSLNALGIPELANVSVQR